MKINLFQLRHSNIAMVKAKRDDFRSDFDSE
jgi:hypothetical protein